MQPQQLYEQAYGYLLQKDYGAAEAGFEDFLKRHPNHQLAGNAQYWLGETFYVRGQYQGRRGRLPEGLSNLRPKPEGARKPAEAGHVAVTAGPEGCRLFLLNELATKYPNPPAHVKSIAQAERQRSGCGA